VIAEIQHKPELEISNSKENIMQTLTTPIQFSKSIHWVGRILSAMPVLFLALDGVMKVVNVQPVMDASLVLGLPVDLAPAIGLLLLACVAIYVIPQSAVLGAILLTGYLGGAISLQVRIGAEPFSLIFPLLLGGLLWGGLYLRDERVRALVGLGR
jgi:hypothetical protein